MPNLLLIGDETLAPYARALEADGFEVKHVHPGAVIEARTPANGVIVDLTTLGEDPQARHYLQRSEDGEAPPTVAILTRGQLDALDPAKAPDDFVLTGASAEELCARVRQVLYRRHGVDTHDVLTFGDLVMDLANYTVHISGRPVELTYKEYELLRFLATNRGRVYTRETLLNKVWGYDFYGGARTVDVHIRRLRAKIEDRHAPFIETVRNVGYRFRTS
jgi:two-component system, OmpR family, alkaline phosphatase synthesis response regulator PhoP